MFSSKYTERHWEIVRDYLVRSYFDDVSMPSFSTTSEDEDANNARSTSSGDLPPPPPITLPRISPLPELIIEKVNHDNLYDDPEEFYDNLEVKVNKLINNIKQASQFDDGSDQDTIKIMDTSQSIATDEENINLSPIGQIRNATYTIVNDFSTENDINDCNPGTVTSVNDSNHFIAVDNRDTRAAGESLHNTCTTANSNDKYEEIYHESCELTINPNNKDTHRSEQQSFTEMKSNNSERDFSIQNSNETYEESITFTVEDGKKPEDYYNSKKKTNLDESNIETESFELQCELVSPKTIANVHCVSAIHKTNLLHSIKTVLASNSPIIGLTVNINNDKNHSENSNSEDSNINHSSEESLQKIVNYPSDSEESTNMERLETILEEGESQIKDTNDRSYNDYEERDETLGSKSQSDSTLEVNDPETMRATNRSSFRTTRYSFTTQEVNEPDIFSVLNKTAKKHLEIQDETEEIREDSNLSLEGADIDTEANTNTDFVTSTPKSGFINHSTHEINAASPELVNKSQQCEMNCFETNKRKRRANNTFNNEHHSMAVEDGKSKWESLKEKFFVGTPKIYRLCNCDHHSCT